MEYSFESIRDRIKEHLINPVNKIEGSFSMDNIGAVSQELARMIMMEVLPIPDNVLVDTAEGIMLDRKALDFNEVRNPAMKSVGEVTFSGVAATKIPKGTILIADSIEFVTTEDATIRESTTVLVKAECSQEGQIGNIPSGKITSLKPSLNGISSVTNAKAFTGGVDEESDVAFRERILLKIQKPITSGNKNHYIYWAKQVSGVGKVKVIPLWNGNGTVKVVILSTDSDMPSDTVIQNVSEYIDENRPIGATVTVVKATPLPVTIEIQLTAVTGYSIVGIKQNIESEVEKYLETIAFEETKNLSYFKIGDIIFDVEGVQDIISYRINGGTTSLTPRFDEFFKLQEVHVNGS